MASSKYDEDVYENPFFMGIMSTYPHVLEKIVKYKGTLCVPRFAAASEHKLTKSDAMDHVLLPRENEEGEEVEEYVTASGKMAKIHQGKIFTEKGFDFQVEVAILFSETFHTDGGGSYKVLCLNGYLNKQRAEKTADNNTTKISSPTSYQQCMDLLWSHSGGQRTRDTLDKLLQTYSKIYERLEGENLRSIVDAANAHFAKAMQLLLKDSVVRKSARHNPHYMDSLKLAVETYLMNAIHKRLFRVITAAMSSQDSEINKITRNIVDLQLTDLGIRKVFSQNIPPAKKELSVLNRYSTPMGRLFCLKRIVTVLSKPPRKTAQDENEEENAMLTSDDLLPILIFLIIKSDIPNWYANLVYMRHFHFAKSSDDDEFGFYLATVEAALEHIRTGNIQDEIQPFTNKRERWNSLTLGEPADLSPTTSTSRQSSSNEPSVIEEFFRYVQEGNEKAVQALLEKPHKASEEIQLMLCHPLCSCDRCDRMLAVFRTKSDLVTAYTRDKRGYTALHMAAYHGQGLLIDLLIKNNAVVDSTDYLGLTPLHLACQRGYQNVMLLLLHFNGDVMATDNEGNTPLHFACANGHEDCVKALVFYDGSVKKLQVNAVNEMKDTALHLAAKWGFESIVKTLLENGAVASLSNRKGQTPVTLAQNVKVQRLLQMAEEGHIVKITRQQSHDSPKRHCSSPPVASSSSQSPNSRRSSLLNSTSSLSSSADSSWSHIETASLEMDGEGERRKKKEKLFKAIMEGDFQLVKFYLGVVEPPVADEYGEEEIDPFLTPSPSASSGIVSDICHPLCQCPKCVTIHRTNRVMGEKVGVNIRTATGSTPLHTAVLHNHSDIVELLISLHADTSAQNHKSLTPLHLACCMRNSLVTDMLVRAGAKLDIQDMNGDTPLLIASSNGFINGAHTLIKAGADINAVNKFGNSALHESAKRNLTDTMGLLVRSGIDVSIVNCNGKTASHITQDAKVQMLIREAEMRGENPRRDRGVSSPVSPSTSHQNKDSREIRSLSMRELFAAFEESDLHTLQSLTESIRSFDRDGSLKQAKTRDASGNFLSKMMQTHSIVNFDKGNLRKVKLLDKSDPLYIYSLSCDENGDENDIHEDLLTPMGDELGKTFSHFPIESEPNYFSGFSITNASGASDEVDGDNDNGSSNEAVCDYSMSNVRTGTDFVENSRGSTTLINVEATNVVTNVADASQVTIEDDSGVGPDAEETSSAVLIQLDS